MTSRLSFFDLPPEVCIQVLLHVPWRDVLVSQQVCKAFQSLIASTQIQYYFWLEVLGYEDAPPSHPMSLSERLEAFKTLHRAFSGMTFPHRLRIPLAGFTPTYELQGGVFIQGRNPPASIYSTIGYNAFRLPGSSSGEAVSHWMVEDLGMPVRDLTLDPSQDLIVLIEGGSVVEEPLSLQFRRLSTGEAHPLAKDMSLHVPTKLSVRSFIAAIMGEYVGFLATHTYFLICNWKTGKMLVAIDLLEEEMVGDFFFLDHRRYVLVKPARQKALEVYELPNAPGPNNPPCLARYRLPVLRPGYFMAVSVRSDPPPISTPSNLTSTQEYAVPPHFVKAEERIIILTLFISNQVQHSSNLLILRAETLMHTPVDAEIIEGTAEVTPALWMKQTRTIRNIIPRDQWMCYCYGSRMLVPIEAQVKDQSSSQTQIRPILLEFNPRLNTCAHSPWDRPEDAMQSAALAERLAEEDMAKISFLEEDWISELPFKVIVSPHIYSVDPTNTMIMMMDDRRFIALMMKENENGDRQPHYMDVYLPG